MILIGFYFHVGSELVHIAFLKVLADEGEFGLILISRKAFLLLDYKGISIL